VTSTTPETARSLDPQNDNVNSSAPVIRTALALAVLAGAQLMIVLDSTIVNIAMPDMQKALGFSETSLTWVMNAYTLTFGGLLLLGGRLGDLLGRRKMFLYGLYLFTAASLLGGFAQEPGLLLASRALQGVGGAVMAPAILSLITVIFAEGPARNKALGVYAAVAGTGAAVGLLLGGVLTQWVSWRWVLFVNVPIGVVLALAIPKYIPVDADRRENLTGEKQFDIPGALTSTLGLTALVYGVIRAAEKGWGNGLTVASLAVAVVLLAAFLTIEMKTKLPLMPLRLFRNRNRTGGYLIMALAGGGMMSSFFFITMYMQKVMGLSPVKSGLAYLPLSVAVIAAAQICSVILPRVGPRVLLTFGPALAGLGLFYLTFLDADSGYALHLLPAMVMLGFGMGFVFVSMMSVATSGIAPEDSGISSAMLNVTQMVGGTIGLSALITISTSASKDEAASQATKHGMEALSTDAVQHVIMTEGWTAALFYSSIMLLAAAVVAVLVVRVGKADVAAPKDGEAPVAMH
jgi:EmrB/QacA subfamily drug resistance transporter